MFEYGVVVFEGNSSAEEMTNKLNMFGVEGWELVTMMPYSSPGLTQALFQAGTTSGFVAVFKKKKEKCHPERSEGSQD